ncbi:MAG: methylaspartate mutase subunit S [Turicibacter sp.]|nr:methylaspartate mutase subunit S [Turicibacter sp.]
MENKITLILGVIGADVHAVGNKILDYAYTKAGFNVVNLGVMVSQKEFIDAAIEASADAMVVSSIYGHGEIDCRGLREKCDEAGLKNIKLYAGGNLVIGKKRFENTEEIFKKMGYDRVYPPGTTPEQSITDIMEDFNLKP